MGKNKAIVYWLLLLVVLSAANIVFSVGEAQARYVNTATWDTVVQPPQGVVSNCLYRKGETPLTVVVTDTYPNTTVSFTLESDSDTSGSLSWYADRPALVQIRMSVDGVQLTSGQIVEVKKGVPVVVDMILASGPQKYEEVNITVNWGTEMTGKFQVMVGIPPVPETEPESSETTAPSDPSESTEPEESTENTEPSSENTEATEPSETTEATEPPATTEPAEPPATTEATEPPATTEATEPPATTEATEPPAATDPEPTGDPQTPGTGTRAGGNQTETGSGSAEVTGEPGQEATPEPSGEPASQTEQEGSDTDPEQTPDTGDTTVDPETTDPNPTEPDSGGEDSGTDNPEPPSTDPSVEVPEGPEEIGGIGSIGVYAPQASFPIHVWVPEGVTGVTIGAKASFKAVAPAPFPPFTRYSLDNGESYYMLYQGGTISTYAVPNQTIMVLVDLSYTALQGEMILGVGFYQGNKLIATGSQYMNSGRSHYVLMDTRILTVDAPLTISVLDNWLDFFSYELEMLTMTVQEDGTEKLEYVPVDPEDSGIWVQPFETEVGYGLVLSTMEDLPPAGTYRMKLYWTYLDTQFAYEEMNFFVNYANIEPPSEEIPTIEIPATEEPTTEEPTTENTIQTGGAEQ